MTGAATPRAFDGVVVDIEGTTTPVSFVYDVLFPYARVRLTEFLRTHSADLGGAIDMLRAEWRDDMARGGPLDGLGEPPASSSDASEWSAYLVWQMDRDRKSPGLKQIQGRIWDLGFADGTLCGEVYPDVAPAFARWHSAEIRIAIYSSGSVPAQRQLFAHSTAGDLSHCIDFYFDTSVGAKREPDSYRRIADTMRLTPPRMLFISDVPAELDAARSIGLATRLCVRDAVPLSTGDHRIVHSFDEVDIAPGKRNGSHRYRKQ